MANPELLEPLTVPLIQCPCSDWRDFCKKWSQFIKSSTTTPASPSPAPSGRYSEWNWRGLDFSVGGRQEGRWPHGKTWGQLL